MSDNNVAMSRPSGTVTLLFTDIEGSTALWETHEAEMETGLARHDELLRGAIEGSGGYVFKTVGDAFCAVFSSAENALEAALQAQRSLGSEIWPEPIVMRVRMGLHTGECQERDSDYFGPVVNRTARLEAVAHGGQILLSGATAVLVREVLPEGCGLIDLGEHRLKDLGVPEHVFQLTAEDLKASFPPLRSLTNPELEHNLPVELTSFIGRDKELKDIHGLVEESHLVTLTGPGGSGKTRLAMQVAADLLDGSADGVWLVDLSPLSADDQVVREVASVLGVREGGARPLFETLVESLQFRSLLLVLDNCEHIIDAVANLAETIVRQCPKVWILATSREPIAVTGERVYRVPPLGLPQSREADEDPAVLGTSEAVRLFVERVNEHRPEFGLDETNASTVASICRHLDGIPLALELAAARVSSMSLEEAERRIGQRFRLLSSRSRTGTARQHTLEGAVAWSHDLLSNEEKLLFASLSVFPASFDLPAAESVCSAAAGMDEFEVVDLVRSLVDKSLIQTEQGPSGMRYRMLETIAQFAGDRLAESPNGATKRTAEVHALYYLGFMEKSAPYLSGFDQIEWIEKLEADYDNIRTALLFLAGGQHHGLKALRMVDALRTFWRKRLGGSLGEAHDLATFALDHLQTQSVTKERCGALLSLGVVDGGLGKFGASRNSLEAGLAMARDIDASTLIAEYLCELALNFYWTGEHRNLKDTAEEALELADAIGDLNLRALAHQRMGVAELMDDPDAARRHFADALRLYGRAGNAWGISVTYLIAGNLEMVEGDLAAARFNHDASLKHAFRYGHRAILLMNLGLISFLEGDVETAGSKYRDSLQQIVRQGAFALAPGALLGLAMCSGASGNLRRSAALHGAADGITEAHGVPWQAPEAGPRERAITTLLHQMGKDAFETAYSQGHEMNPQDAVALGFRGDEEDLGVPTLAYGL